MEDVSMEAQSAYSFFGTLSVLPSRWVARRLCEDINILKQEMSPAERIAMMLQTYFMYAPYDDEIIFAVLWTSLFSDMAFVEKVRNLISDRGGIILEEPVLRSELFTQALSFWHARIAYFVQRN